MPTTPIPGPWNYACDSYGKVRHSKDACVYATVRGEGGERIEKLAGRIPNWGDAKMMAAAPKVLAALRAAELVVGDAVEEASDPDNRAAAAEALAGIRAALAEAGSEGA